MKRSTKKLTREKFIKKSISVHGYKYNYSNVIYINNKTEVIIICPFHGKFLQTPSAHTSQKQGCPKCGGTKKLTTKEFIILSKKVHGNKYDYSKTIYVNAKTKIIIICPIHGEFNQIPDAHASQKQGCPKCYEHNKLTTKKFVKKARKVHGNKYDYGKVDYKGINIKVIIICPKHGKFKQTPFSHLMGQGCSSCFGNTKHTTRTFVKIAKKVHGNKYNYNKVDYTNSITSVIIICPIHGEFNQIPCNHINQKQGCPKCSAIIVGEKHRYTTQEFIIKSKKVHGNKYDYGKVNYINTNKKVIIICPKHGEFKQVPSSHICHKTGCPKCQSSKGEIAVRTILDKYNLNYVQQKSFNNCRNPKTNRKLQYDFYLPKCNILLEYNGEQHYKHVDYLHHHKKNTFAAQQYRDSIKKDYALSNGYKFLVIKYNDKNIEEIIKKAINR